MTKTSFPRGSTIAVWGHYHGGNVGDDLVVATIVNAIRRRIDDAHVVGISLAPADARTRHGIEGYPINPRLPNVVPRTATGGGEPERRSLAHAAARRSPLLRWLGVRALQAAAIAREVPFCWRSYRLLRGTDLVLVAGSGQLDEWGGTWYHAWTLFRWAALARLARVPMVYPSVGAGPINTKLGAWFIGNAVNWAARITVRDPQSADVLRSIGLSRAFPVFPDMAYGLPEALRGSPPPPRSEGDGPVVGLSVMAYQDPRYWLRGDHTLYEAYLGKMAAFARRLLAERATVLLCAQTSSDDRVAEDVVRLVGEVPPGGRLVTDRAIELEDLATTIRGCDIVVGARFHFALISLLVGVPTLALAYNPKTADLLAAVGRPEQCLDIASFDEDSLTAAFDRLRDPEPAGARGALRDRVREHGEAVEAQFDAIFGPARSGPSANGASAAASDEPVARPEPRRRLDS